MADDLKNLLLIGLGVSLAASLGFMGYTYKTKDISPKGSTTKQAMSFESLPPSVQQAYISRDDHFIELDKLEQEKEALAGELEGIISDSKQQKFLKKTARMQKDSDEELTLESVKTGVEKATATDRSNFKTYTCKEFEKGSIAVPRSCKKALYGFIDKYKTQAKEFEIIGMVDKTEFKLIQNLEDVYGNDEVKRVKKYVQIGLSRQRVIETTWLAKERLNNNMKVGAVNYTVYSKNKRGFVIRAYF